MQEINGIVFGDDITPQIHVTKAEPLSDMMMLLEFDDGSRKLFDATILKGKVFEKLKDESVFSSPSIEYGVVTWDDGNIDVAPEYMYAYSYVYNQEDIISA